MVMTMELLCAIQVNHSFVLIGNNENILYLKSQPLDKEEGTHQFTFFFFLQFLPHSGDRILVTGAADTKVHVHDLTVKETIHMFSDHTNRVKRIATAPMWPNTFWSAAEDGIIR